ncbi:hypothetical protein TCAL_08636 [Tigriopus californicus]|uniref:Mitochondrial Rho GTPase n=1 Tax=Tigriopus californicus TaxID=6832 RepID=A0A553NU64_TIGCA|nr:hypothetical protein TCAL_08636 [Tigriopus californicus]|eukprot:TCALIF_08636-PA protein Name:"Similar to Miro Mitochondrial Rho GTPase (Drosophila melanogaster)" AED:0.08 eAED:0.08 QI:164/0.90/0.91/1/0.81/0.75/12/861/604
MFTQTRKVVRILLIGDRSVGKTSLILSLVSEEFPQDVPPRAEEITIPGDLTPEKVPTCIVDFSSLEQSDSMLEMEIKKADVIALVYAVDDEDTLDSVTDHWLPFVHRTLGDCQRKPLILVGNKVDLIDYSTMEAVLPIMNEYEEIETCVECSAKNLKNISEMFYFAQKAVLHPSAPLWNYMDKEELGLFQKRCFHMDLETGTLDSLKAVVLKSCAEGLTQRGLTVKGFLTLNSLFIQRGRHETTWTILRKFGYDDDLTLHREYLFPVLKVPHAASVELSHEGYDFFTTIFEKYDKDGDKALSPQELVNLFSTCPVMPWGPDVYHTVVTSQQGYISLPGYLGLWSLSTLLDTQKTLEYLAYLGYPYYSGEDNQISALQTTRNKKLDLAKKQTSRNVYRCHVIGPKDAGKTTFCQGILGNSRADIAGLRPEDLPRHTISIVQVYGQEKYLVLEDIDVRNVTDSLMPSEVHCDVCCLVYDVTNPRSFEFVARIFLKYFADGKIPVLICGNKSELPAVRQDYILQPEGFCNKHKLPPPQPISSARGVKMEIFVKLATMAAFPHMRHLGGLVGEETSFVRLSLFGLALAALGGFLALKIINQRQLASAK